MLYEIVFHGRGGQGAVTASNVLVQAAIHENLHGQSYPFFGAERRGAPVTAYARISDKPILKHSMIREADIVVVLDDSLLRLGAVKRTILRPEGTLIVNTAKSTIEKSWINTTGPVHVYAVNATKIALDLGLVLAGWPLVNTPMLGAVVKALKNISIKSVEKALLDYFGERAGKVNAEAAYRAYEEVAYLGELR